MDEKEFKKRASRLEEVGKVIEKLPAEMREPAFQLLREYVGEQAAGFDGKKSGNQSTKADSGEDDESFFAKFTHETPADNAKLIAANFYRKYGSAAFSIDEVRQCATDVGVTIPARVDATFNAAREKGNKLFMAAGRGKYKPTVHGEAVLKATYSVKKGTRPKANE